MSRRHDSTGFVQRLERRYAARADTAYARYLTNAWLQTAPPRPAAEPPELSAALGKSASGRGVYDSLEPEERYELCWFVSNAWLRHNRKSHAKTVVRKCEQGIEAVRFWLDFNRTVWDVYQSGGTSA